LAVTYTPKYATVSDLQAAVGGPVALQELSDRANASIDNDAVLTAIRSADGEIDSRARGLADYGWVPVPKEAIDTAILIAIYYLYKNVWRRVPQDVKDSYTAAIETLEKLKNKEISWSDGIQPQTKEDGNFFESFNPASDDPGDDNPRRSSLRGDLDLL
jgi:phage gp36-like protein